MIIERKKDFVSKLLESQVDMLIERRIAGSKEEERESVKGEGELKLKPPRKSAKTKAEPKSIPLERFMTNT